MIEFLEWDYLLCGVYQGALFILNSVCELPKEQTVTFEGHVTGHVTESADVTDDVAEAEEFPIEPPISEGNPSGMWAYSVLDGGGIPHEELQRRKGYHVEERS